MKAFVLLDSGVAPNLFYNDIAESVAAFLEETKKSISVGTCAKYAVAGILRDVSVILHKMTLKLEVLVLKAPFHVFIGGPSIEFLRPILYLG